MKKIFLTPIFLALFQIALAQQCPAAAVPYEFNGDDAAVPLLPECVYSVNNTFSSQEVFETISGPVAGYNGNILAYDTTINTQDGIIEPSASVAASLYSRKLLLTAGEEYTISYRYGNSSPSFTIDNLEVSLTTQGGGAPVTIATHQNITGATATTFVSPLITVPQTGEYFITFNVWTTGTQGFLYLDEIKMTQGIMAVNDAAISGLVTYPNPVNDILTITHSSSIDTLELFNITGQRIHHEAINNNYASVNMQEFAAGVYVLSLRAGNDKKTIKVVKQ